MFCGKPIGRPEATLDDCAAQVQDVLACMDDEFADVSGLLDADAGKPSEGWRRTASSQNQSSSKAHLGHHPSQANWSRVPAAQAAAAADAAASAWARNRQVEAWASWDQEQASWAMYAGLNRSAKELIPEQTGPAGTWATAGIDAAWPDGTEAVWQAWVDAQRAVEDLATEASVAQAAALWQRSELDASGLDMSGWQDAEAEAANYAWALERAEGAWGNCRGVDALLWQGLSRPDLSGMEASALPHVQASSLCWTPQKVARPGVIHEVSDSASTACWTPGTSEDMSVGWSPQLSVSSLSAH